MDDKERMEGIQALELIRGSYRNNGATFIYDKLRQVFSPDELAKMVVILLAQLEEKEQ